jgi:hypothetical protein
MRSSLRLAAVIVLVFAMSARANESPPALTPDEAVQHDRRKPSDGVLTIKFRVRDVAESNPEWTYLYADQLANGEVFAVKLSQAAKRALNEAGKSNLATCFSGQEITVQGHLEMVTVWCFPARELYSIRVDSLEQLLERQPMDTSKPR